MDKDSILIVLIGLLFLYGFGFITWDRSEERKARNTTACSYERTR